MTISEDFSVWRVVVQMIGEQVGDCSSSVMNRYTWNFSLLTFKSYAHLF